MRKTLYLHIGTPKSGTTTLQHFLTKNQARLAAEHGLFYPPPSSVPYGFELSKNHLILPYSVLRERAWPSFVPQRDRVSADVAFGALQRDIETTVHPRILVSSEDFSVHGTYSRPLLERVAGLTGCDKSVVVYLRPQSGVLESLYSWNPDLWKTGRTLEEIAADPNAGLPPWLDYQRMLAPWRETLGDDAIDCRILDSEAGSGDTITATLAGFGIENAGFEPVGRLNTARQAGVIEFFRRTLPALDPSQHDRYHEELRPIVRDAVGSVRYPMLSDAASAAFMERFEAGNSELACAFFGRDALFPSQERERPDPSAEELLTLDEVLRTFVTHWSQQHAASEDERRRFAAAEAWRTAANRWRGLRRRLGRRVRRR